MESSSTAAPGPASELAYRSAVDGIVWPALPTPRASAILALLYQFQQSEWWSPEKIREMQFRQAAQLLDHAYHHVPFYRERLGEIRKIEPRGKLTPEKWARIPLLRRAEIQAVGDALHSKSLPKKHGKVGENFTSGSTGKPVRIMRSDLFTLVWQAVSIRNHLWHRPDFGGTLAIIRDSTKGVAPYPDGTRHGNWGTPNAAGIVTGPSVRLNMNSSLEQQIDWLQRNDPDYILTLPSNVRRLAEYSIKKGIELPKLRQLLTISEVVKPEVRDLCREAWGASIADLYSGRDVGYLALQCPDYDHHHIQSEISLVEILNDADEPCEVGEVGRVVVTPLHNFAMPLIRYDIGDFARVGAACPCGRGLPVIQEVMGRTQQLLTLPSGETRLTLLSAKNIRALLDLAPITQYQFVQKNLEDMEVRLAAERELTPGEEDKVQGWVHDKFGDHFAVDFRYYDEIPRTAAGKFPDFVSEVPTDR